MANEHNLSILTVNFDTPEYIFALNKSFYKQNKWFNGEFIVVDNGNTKTLPETNNSRCKVIYFDKSLYEPLNILPKSKYPAAGNYNSAHHALTVDWAIENLINTDYLLLVDSDIIITSNVQDLFNEFLLNNYALMGFKRTQYACPCIAPWFSFINVKLMHELQFKFFDINRILYVHDNLTHDTGASLYEDFSNANCKIKTFDDNLYYRHLKGGSVKKLDRLSYINKYKMFL